MKFLETVVYMTILRVYEYLEQTGRESSFARFPFLGVLAERLPDKDEGVQESVQEDILSIQAERYQKVLTLIENDADGDSVLETVLDLCLTVMQVPEFAAYLTYYTGNIVTIQLAYELEGIAYPDYTDAVNKLERLQKICYVDWKKVSLLYAGIEGSNRLLGYLMGNDSMNPDLLGTAEWFSWEETLHPMYIRSELAKQGAECMSVNNTLLQISGGGGRRFLARHISQILKKDMLFVGADKFEQLYQQEGTRYLRCLIHECILKNGAVCIYGITKEVLEKLGAGETEFLEYVIRSFEEVEIPVIVCTGAEVNFRGGGGMGVRRISLSETTREERELVWKGFAELYGIPVDCARFSVRYRLLASEIARAVQIATAENLWGKDREKDVADMQFSRICYEILCDGTVDPIGTVIYPSVGMQDLKVEEAVLDTLGQICCGLLEGHRIYEEWNLKQQYPYGRAVTVLLAGPPGTGKTMTAHVLAKELGIPLYQVDLSHIMDKYIGETEKHLEQAFAFAEKTNMVLFFDEADSLFGKRGEVTEGKDRYANMEVSYILQRIEQFEGIAVLATNFYNNIDKAFLRRMKYVLKYQKPDKQIRRSIWERCLPPELPKEELDLDYLAEQFDFTGGMIKNVVLNACIMSIYEGRKMHMVHLLKAVQAEYEKMERNVGKEVFGEYGYLMEE